MISYERWSDRMYVRRKSALRVFDAFPCQNAEQALAAVANEWSTAEGATHPLDARLAALAAEVTQLGPTMYLIRYPYAPVTTAGNEKLDLPMEFDWDIGWSTSPLSNDGYGNPISNSAGARIATGLTIDNMPTDYLSVYRWESSYDFQKAQFFRRTVNSKIVMLGGRYKIFPGQCHCLSILPAGLYPATAEVIRIAYRFEFVAGEKIDADGFSDAFKLRYLDEGTQGWYMDTEDGDKIKPGRFVTAQGERLDEPVRLNGAGQPKDTTIKVERTAGVLKPAQAKSPAVPDTVAREYVGQTDVYLKFLRRRPADHTTIFS